MRFLPTKFYDNLSFPEQATQGAEGPRSLDQNAESLRKVEEALRDLMSGMDTFKARLDQDNKMTSDEVDNHIKEVLFAQYKDILEENKIDLTQSTFKILEALHYKNIGALLRRMYPNNTPAKQVDVDTEIAAIIKEQLPLEKSKAVEKEKIESLKPTEKLDTGLTLPETPVGTVIENALRATLMNLELIYQRALGGKWKTENFPTMNFEVVLGRALFHGLLRAAFGNLLGEYLRQETSFSTADIAHWQSKIMQEVNHLNLTPEQREMIPVLEETLQKDPGFDQRLNDAMVQIKENAKASLPKTA